MRGVFKDFLMFAQLRAPASVSISVFLGFGLILHALLLSSSPAFSQSPVKAHRKVGEFAGPLSPVPPQHNKLPAPYVFRFGVNWEVLRSGFNTLNVALESEAFSETWLIEQDSHELIYLSSPRARIPVVGIQANGPNYAPFDTVILPESALAQLLGIQHPVLEGTEKWIFLELPIRDSEPQHFILTASPRYFISVTISLIF